MMLILSLTQISSSYHVCRHTMKFFCFLDRTFPFCFKSSSSSSTTTSRIGPLDPFRLHRYNCSLQCFVGLPVVLLLFEIYVYKEKKQDHSVTLLCLSCKNGCMSRLYLCGHHQAGNRTLNKRTRKCGAVKFWGQYLVFTSMHNDTKLYKNTESVCRLYCV